MLPVICTIGPFTLYSYGLLLVIAFVVAVQLAQQEAKRQKVNPDFIFNLCFFVFLSGIIGARLMYVLQHAAFYFSNPLEIIMLQHGGLSWFGGLFLGSIVGLVYIKRNNASVIFILDLIIPYVALAQGIGRIGCLFNGCCYGKVSDFGLYVPSQDAILIPTQIFSSLAMAGIFIVLRVFQVKPHSAGKIFFIYLVLYGMKRFFMEFLRGDTVMIFAGLTIFQIMSIFIFCVGLGGLLRRKRS